MKKRNFWLMLLFSLLTFGIYGIYFWWTLINDANELTAPSVERVPEFWKNIIFSILTCGIYSFFWIYKLGNNQNANGSAYQVGINETGVLHLILILVSGFTCGITGIISSYIIVNNHNKLVEAYNNRG